MLYWRPIHGRHICSLVFVAIGLLALLVIYFSWTATPATPLKNLTSKPKSLESPRRQSRRGPRLSEITMLPAFDLTSIDLNIRTSLSSNNSAQLEKTYFAMMTQNHTVCPHSVRVGDLNDGGYNVCLTAPFNIEVDAGCIAFSFGINHVYAYDNELATKYKCTVRMFDPSMTTVADGPIGTGRRQWFYKRGLAGHRFIHNGFELDKLCSILDEFAGADTTIDLLKIDIEKWEWESLETALSEGCLARVKQLVFETHTALPVKANTLKMAGSVTPDYARYLRVWSGIIQQGFRMWKSYEEPLSFFYPSVENDKRRVPCRFNIFMINWNFMQSP